MNRLTVLVLACSLTLALPISVGANGSPTVKVNSRILSIAKAHLSDAVDVNPELANAVIAPNGYPIYRPDIDSVAYYEVIYHLPNGSAGYVMVSTGKHDLPVAQWALFAKPNTEKLNEVLKCEFVSKTDRVYMIDDVTFAVIRNNGSLCGKIGNGIWLTDDDSWAKYRSDYAAELKKQKQHTIRAIAESWREVDERQSTNKSKLSKIKGCTWTSRWAGTQADQMLYSQLKPGEAPNNTSCSSGCGATAWAMLFGWIDTQAKLGNDKWRNAGKIFGDLVTAPSNTMSPDVKSAIWELQGDLDTECIGDQGYTLPNKMSGAGKFLNRRGYSAEKAYVRWDPLVNWDRTDEADEAIAQGEPVIIGLGIEHYPLAFGYRKGDCRPARPDKHEFYINDGHGGDFRWTSSRTWFVGRALFASPPQSGGATCASRGMKSCPNGCWNPSSYPRCVPLDYDCPPDLCTGCPPNKRCCEPGYGSNLQENQTCRLCIPRTGGYVCP